MAISNREQQTGNWSAASAATLWSPAFRASELYLDSKNQFSFRSVNYHFF